MSVVIFGLLIRKRFLMNTHSEQSKLQDVFGVTDVFDPLDQTQPIITAPISKYQVNQTENPEIN